MSFLAPATFALAILLPIIIAMYLLKLRRTEQVVSSTYLWQQMVRDVEANAPWQRLRRNLLLILQLLFLIALIFALARPFTRAQGTLGQAAIFILDTSASMGATDVSPSRIEAAKSQALQLVDGLPDEARVTVIAAGNEAQVMVASTQDRRQANLAIERIQAGTGGSDIGVALELASAIAARQPDTEIVVLSDGKVTLPERMALKGRLRYLPIGIRGGNQAISLLTLEPAPGGGSLTTFAQVTNYATEPVERRLTLSSGGQLINAYDLDLPAGGQQAVLAEGLPAEIDSVEAQLTGEDDLSTDDRATAVQRSAEPARINLVSQGNLFLETGLALLPGVEVTQAEPTDASLEPASLTIFDNYVPVTETLPLGNLLFIAPPRSTEFFTVTGSVEGPALQPADETHPLLQHVSLSEISVLDAARISLPDWARPVIADGDTPGDSAIPLLFAGEVEGRRIAVLAFDLHRSDLPLHVAFPVLLANLTGWLAPGSGSDIPLQVAPGAALSFNLPPEVESVSVARPDGSTTRLPVESGRAILADTTELGVYRLTWGRGEDAEPAAGTGTASFAVNLFSPQESDLEPAGALPALEGAGAGNEGSAGPARREWWRPLALLSLGLLTAEWLVYQRSGLSRLRSELKRVIGRIRS